MRLFRELSIMRIADREQVMIAAGFGSITRANRRLLALLARDSSGASFSGSAERGKHSMRCRRKERVLRESRAVAHEAPGNHARCGLLHGAPAHNQ